VRILRIIFNEGSNYKNRLDKIFFTDLVVNFLRKQNQFNFMINHQIKSSFIEFVALMALYVALMAMSIDMILPALAIMGKEFGVENENQTQFVIGILFLGFTFGQIIYGPIADSFGRKPTIYAGLAIFAFGNILSIFSNSFEVMLLGRFLQGFGAASPRIVGIAIVRDLYKGREMARVMSFVTTVFIIIPVIAPSIGQIILLAAKWRVIFVIFLSCSIIAMIWTFMRLPETLKKQDIRPFKKKFILQDFRKVLSNKITVCYAICTGLIFGAMVGYLSSSRQIFQDYFQVGEQFSIYFGISALSIGAASILNSAIVRKYGMRLICHRAIIVMAVASLLFLLLLVAQNNQATIWQFMIFILVLFFCFGLLFGNLNAMAMEPMGHIAGVASAIVGALSSAISAILGTTIGQFYNSTLTPLVFGFFVLSILAFILQKMAGNNSSNKT
jgi:DHA1 family bicyclomycin/chloramphenicol resistance-like MFS transporter